MTSCSVLHEPKLPSCCNILNNRPYIFSPEVHCRHIGPWSHLSRMGQGPYHHIDQSNTLPSAEIESYIQLFCGGFQVPNTCLFVCWVLALTQNISRLTRLLVKKRNQDHAKGTIWQPLVWFASVLKSELLLSLEHRPSI